jgi:predicted nucleic acid-binding protein
VVLPTIVLTELSHPLAPEAVRLWAAQVPDWLEVLESPDGAHFPGIHKGEAAAIALAAALQAELLLMDDRRGVIAAEKQGLNVTGTLGILEIADKHKLLDFSQAAEALQATTFRMPVALLDELLAKHKRGA